ncbi:MAG: SDR family NAD(P)-dependent oxidoreductase [Candidatus Rokubacteria bacterium]|nr:SDR family NAD(P)-dependent oxidoreductase [Candidatus Rokubacteria bacterium]
MKLDGRVAIVTGAGRGIGRAIARAFAADGAAVVLASRTPAELAAAAAEIRDAGGRVLVVPTDVTAEAAVEALVREALTQFSRVDILVCAAGSAAFGPVADAKTADWDAMLAVNLRGVMLACRAVLPAMIGQRAGTIINIASIAARRAIPGAAAYSATKAGVVAFSRVLAEELRGAGVRVGVLLPVAVDTQIWDAVPDAPDRAKMLRPDEVAAAALLIATLPPSAALEELTLLPAGGIL